MSHWIRFAGTVMLIFGITATVIMLLSLPTLVIILGSIQ